MGGLTLTVVRLGLLIALWVFVFGIVGVIRSDLYGTRIVRTTPDGKAKVRPTPNTPRRARGKKPTSLTIVEGRLRGTTIPLMGGPILVGRNPECTVVLDDDFASGRHARIFEDDQCWYVEDLGSTNGTFVGGQRIDAPTLLGEGTRLQIGSTVLELRR